MLAGEAGLLFLASIALLIPSAPSPSALSASAVDRVEGAFTLQLSVGLSPLLIVAYALGLLFSLGTHAQAEKRVARQGRPSTWLKRS